MNVRFHPPIRGSAPLAGLVLLIVAPALRASDFDLQFSEKVRHEPFTGRVVLFFCPDEKALPSEWDMLSHDPVASIDVKDWKPGADLHVEHARAYPTELDKLDGKFQVCAVMENNTTVPFGLDSPGDLRSPWKTVELKAGDHTHVALKIARHTKPRKKSAERIGAEEVTLKSKLLSDFHHRDVTMRALIRFPEEYESDAERKFPVVYFIPGFGGDHFQGMQIAGMLGDTASPFIRIGLDPTLEFGHTTFADSDNNGPCGRALTEELIPFLEKKYRIIAEPRARYLTGHSSGGWSSLWLQVAYPDFFNGCWAGSPDSVDFHDWCGVNLYEEANFYEDAKHHLWPICRENGKVMFNLKDLAMQEYVIGPGGQVMAMEAVYGPRGDKMPSGEKASNPDSALPVPLFDRLTGKIDHRVMEKWRRYDIVDKIDREWKTIGPKLKGKITVIMGGEDTFYLNGATKRLKDKLAALGSDARVFIVPGADHGTVLFSKPYRSVMSEINERFEASKKD